MNKDRELVIQHFREVVNMSPKQLESWLENEDSQKVGQKDGNNESVGHKSGKYIVNLLQKQRSEYSDEDIAHMQKVISYVRRHSAQRPSGDIKDSRWRFSLMNWGHDPDKVSSK
jgi:Protein of unknown function (DUF3140)